MKHVNETDTKNGVATSRLLNDETELKRKECERPSKNGKTEGKEEKKTVLSKISEHLDLDLLKDNCYVAVILGEFVISSLIECNIFVDYQCSTLS